MLVRAPSSPTTVAFTAAVCEELLPVGASAAPSTSEAIASVATPFCEATRAKGSGYFGESADNLTAVIVDLSPLEMSTAKEVAEATEPSVQSARVSVAMGRLSTASDMGV